MRGSWQGGVPAGQAVGRNIFQHQKPQAITRANTRVFRNRWTAKQAMEELAGAMR
jgi:DhnA family fructose-bisphosphate aldolase class Ia